MVFPPTEVRRAPRWCKEGASSEVTFDQRDLEGGKVKEGLELSYHELQTLVAAPLQRSENLGSVWLLKIFFSEQEAIVASLQFAPQLGVHTQGEE